MSAKRISEAKKRYEELCDERDALNHECAAAEEEWLELQREHKAESSTTGKHSDTAR